MAAQQGRNAEIAKFCSVLRELLAYLEGPAFNPDSAQQTEDAARRKRRKPRPAVVPPTVPPDERTLERARAQLERLGVVR